MKLTPEIQLAIMEAVEQERTRSDGAYAIKLAERILFGILALFGAGTIAYIVSLLFKHP